MRLKKTLNEAVFGPADLSIVRDFHPSGENVVKPDLEKELASFRGTMVLDDLVQFEGFKGTTYKKGGLHIEINEKDNFDVSFRGADQVEIPGVIEYNPKYAIGLRLAEPYKPPLYGVTCLGPSHGFDPTENTSGFIVWLNHNGIMIDPPVDSTEWLEDSNVNPKLIDSIILTHCHADHDAGTFQKILEEGRITIYSTHTVMESFLRKYSSLSNEPVSYLRKLFRFHPLYLGQPTYIHGGEFNFYYSLHSIPTIGFTLAFQNQSFVYSSDHQADPEVQKKLLDENVIDMDRYIQLQEFPWSSDVIYHESGIPPLHTPIKYLNSLPSDVQKKTVVYHIAEKDFPEETDLTLATFGIENTLYYETTPPHYERMYQLLDVLKHLDFFDSLPVEKVQEFISIVSDEEYTKGDIIINKGSRGEKFFIIGSGNVKIIDETLNYTKIFSTYEYFGEIALMTEARRTATVLAETDVLVYTIEKNKFLSFISGTDFEDTLERLIRNRSTGVWDVLNKSSHFSRLSSYQKTWLESIVKPVRFEGKGILVREGREFEKVYIIKSGKVFVSRKRKHNKTLTAGGFIGSVHSPDDEAPSPYTYSHDDDIALFEISREDLRDFLNKNPGVSMKLNF